MYGYAQTTESPKTPLCSLFLRYRSDKCPQIFHSYSEHYHELLNERRDRYRTVVEIGVGSAELMSVIVGDGYVTGASLKAWKDYFPNAVVFGLDNDPGVLFEDERIHCLLTDQSDSASLEASAEAILQMNGHSGIDLIVDDGSHRVADMLLSFRTLFRHLNRGGIYLIEDIKKSEISLFEDMDLQGGRMLKSFPGNLEWEGFVAVEKR